MHSLTNLSYYRVYWENDVWLNARKHIWMEHLQFFCSNCYISLHARCNWEEIPDKISAQEILVVVKKIVNQIRDNASSLNVDYYIKGFSEKFKIFYDSLTQIDKKFENILNNL